MDDDDGSETGSESMFQTAPDDEELADTTDNKTAALVDKPLDDMDGFESDASSDILQPTQVMDIWYSFRHSFLLTFKPYHHKQSLTGVYRSHQVVVLVLL